MYTSARLARRGFTLSEVLVVIAMASILLALSLPAYRRVKEMADSTKCMNNLRSWGTSFQMYATEHGGLYPLSWWNNSDNWTEWMAPYVEMKWFSYAGPPTFAKRLDVSKCGCPYWSKVQHPDPLYRRFPYSYNAGRFDYAYRLHSHIRGQEIENGIMYAGGWDIDPGTISGIIQRYGVGSWGGETGDHIDKYAHVPPTILYDEPAESEVLFCGWASHWRYYAYPYVHWFSSPPSGWDYNVRTGDGYMGDYNQMPLNVHGGRDNYLMMDGHVVSMERKDPMVNWCVYNDIPARGNPWNDFETPGSGPVYVKGQDPEDTRVR